MTKWKNFGLAVLTIMITANVKSQPNLVLERVFDLTNFPSGSALEFYGNRFFAVGDDATHLLIFNPDYGRVDSIRLFKGLSRIDKNKKADLEASTIANLSSNTSLFLLGSSSTAKREILIVYPLEKSKMFSGYQIERFNKRARKAGVNVLNYEGLASINDQIIIANRGNTSNPVNQLIVTTTSFYSNQKNTPIHVVNLKLNSPSFIGISGLEYVPQKDLLLFTASTEATTNSYDDGLIGDSYLGYISNFLNKISLKEITPDGLINLSKNNQEFSKQKIESVCLQEVIGNELILHLISDNDNGTTTLFKMRWQF